MKVLIVPMAALAETAGSFARARALACALDEAGIGAASCAAIDSNYKRMPGIHNYYLSVPAPLGLPMYIASRTFPAARRLGITSRKTVRSFEEVLYLTGNLHYPYLKKSVGDIIEAIRQYNPDVVYSEFNLSAVIAARLEGRRLFMTASLPTRVYYANSPRYSDGLRKLLKEYGLPSADSCLELFSWADRLFVPSCPELEPLEEENAVFCGAWNRKKQKMTGTADAGPVGNKILMYMGSGNISPKKALGAVSRAFSGRSCEIYAAGEQFTERSAVSGQAKIYTARRFDFGKLLPESVLFINHGGQNSIADGLVYGVPQLICPGKVFERQYNARSIVKAGAGLELEYNGFSRDAVARCADIILSDGSFCDNARRLGQKLLELGGTDNVVNELRNIC